MVTGDDSVPTGALPNNGIVIAPNVTSGDRIRFQCRSGSTDTGVGQLVDLDGSTFNIGENSGVFSVQRTWMGSVQSGSLQFHNRAGTEPALTAAHEGVYSCRIPDESGSDVDVNIGVYRNGFNSKYLHFSGEYLYFIHLVGKNIIVVAWQFLLDVFTMKNQFCQRGRTNQLM